MTTVQQYTMHTMTREYAAEARRRLHAGHSMRSVERALGHWSHAKQVAKDVKAGGFFFDPVNDPIAIERVLDLRDKRLVERLSLFEWRACMAEIWRRELLWWQHDPTDKSLEHFANLFGFSDVRSLRATAQREYEREYGCGAA